MKSASVRAAAVAAVLFGAIGPGRSEALTPERKFDVCSIDQWLDEAQRASDTCSSIGYSCATVTSCGVDGNGNSFATGVCSNNC